MDNPAIPSHPGSQAAWARPSLSGTNLARVVNWRGRQDVVLLTWRAPAVYITPEMVLAEINKARGRGVKRLLTAALNRREQAPYLAAGFVPYDRLHLLSRDLDVLPFEPRVNATLRKPRREDFSGALHVDRRAFEPFWQLDQAGLDDALKATTAVRMRVAVTDVVVGYSVMGRSGTNGFLQRLAVNPETERNGIGSQLVIDGLRWLRRRRTQRVVVNTQVTNQAALALYERLGFNLEPEGLAVLTFTEPC